MPDIDASDIVLNAGPGGYGAGVKPQWFNPATLADYGGQTFPVRPQRPQGASMPDPNQPQPGALNSASVYGQGALQGGPPPQQQMPQMQAPPQGFGDTLQGVGAWLQAANNPGGAASLLQGLQAKQQLALERQKMMMPQVIDMGTDMFGQKRPQSIWNPANNTMVPIGAGGGQGGQQGGQTGASGSAIQGAGLDGKPSGTSYSPSGNDFVQAFNDYKAGKIGLDTLTKSAPGMVQQEADALIGGTASPSDLGNKNPGLRQGGIMLAQAKDPNFNPLQIPARIKTISDLADTGNKSALGGALSSSEKIINHMDGYLKDAQDLANLKWWPAQNDMGNLQDLIKAHSTDTNYKKIQNSMAAHADFLSSEVSSLAAGGKATGPEREAQEARLASAKSLPEQIAAVRAMAGVMRGTVDPFVSKYNLAFGTANGQKNTNGKSGIYGNGQKTTEDFWDPKTTATYNKIMGPNPTGAPDQPAQAGAPAQAPAAPAAPVAGAPIDRARAAIAAGAPRDAVIQRLKQNGIDPGGL